MYQYKHASVGMKPKQVTIINPACPICGKPMDNGRQRVVATVRRENNRKREYTHSWTSFEICAEHDITDAGIWLPPNVQLGVIVKPELMEGLS